MFLLAILLGIFGYGIFFLGIFGVLYTWSIGVWSVVMIGIGIWLIRKHCYSFSLAFLNDKISKIAFFLLALLAVVNGIGVLGPELSFDALWYHLTLPKLYLQQHSISFIPGGLLYYSVMPKLGEMFFIPTLAFSNEIGAKLVQYLFGILTTIALYKFSRRYFSVSLSLLGCLVFYSNIVVAWESTVAYIDLIRAFYEVLALWAFIIWVDTKKLKWVYICALMVGFVISTKVLSLGTVGIFTLLIVIVLWKQKSISIKNLFYTIFVYWVITLLIPFPWFIFSLIYTGNPLYPFFTSIYPVVSAENIWSIQTFFEDSIKLFLFSEDPISPIYLIVLPLVFLYFSKLKVSLKLIGIYCLLAFIFWYVTPRTGGGRFILPYLSIWSLLVVAIIDQVKKQKLFYMILVVSIFFIAIMTCFYRGIANKRYIPVILGKETKQNFLTNHLNFSYGDFYDTDGYFQKTIQPTDTVLLFGFHNLYYVDFPFIHHTWIKKGDRFNYIATQNSELPKRFVDWDLIYENKTTSVRLYMKGNKSWDY